eukprot:CAMPEP_0115865686 /NCGR_PEP_ID=MMETSP0287-20121206/19851_1 /TAXON_ID=412157 /ORGANISM="Chrysochromulina rotalis, Strain UIO044" /LENGTH=71 /DNA_ID=CAMNT_0003320209 /DNA_START=713 /DNA_END=928 /DNA_ORIENTATION=+
METRAASDADKRMLPPSIVWCSAVLGVFWKRWGPSLVELCSDRNELSETPPGAAPRMALRLRGGAATCLPS